MCRYYFWKAPFLRNRWRSRACRVASWLRQPPPSNCACATSSFRCSTLKTSSSTAVCSWLRKLADPLVRAVQFSIGLLQCKKNIHVITCTCTCMFFACSSTASCHWGWTTLARFSFYQKHAETEVLSRLLLRLVFLRTCTVFSVWKAENFIVFVTQQMQLHSISRTDRATSTCGRMRRVLSTCCRRLPLIPAPHSLTGTRSGCAYTEGRILHVHVYSIGFANFSVMVFLYV